MYSSPRISIWPLFYFVDENVFFVKISLYEIDNPDIIIGQKSMCIITIIDDDSKIEDFFAFEKLKLQIFY